MATEIMAGNAMILTWPSKKGLDWLPVGSWPAGMGKQVEQLRTKRIWGHRDYTASIQRPTLRAPLSVIRQHNPTQH